MVDLNVAILTTLGQNIGAYAYALQKARPIADISTGTWTPSSGSDLYAMLDEESPDDSDYIRSGAEPNGDTCEVKLGGLFDPGVSYGHSLFYRISRTGSTQEQLVLYLMEGEIERDSWVEFPPTGTVTCEHPLSVSVANSISDYTNLRVRMSASAITGNLWYVDNTASGANNGTSWTDAWESFASISWASIQPGDTIYISGGESTKTYYEQLSLGTSGNFSNFINIRPGAVSPLPSGHSGIVIIDGQDTRKWCIYNNQRSYIRIDGIDNSGNYKIRLQNAIQSDATGACVYSYLGSYIYLYHLDMDMPKSRGLMTGGTTHGIVHGCDVRTGDVDTIYQTDCLYVGTDSNDWILENNICIVGNLDTAESHCDPIQANFLTNITVRGNYLAYPTAVDVNEIGMILGGISGTCYIYNNVIIGPDTDQEKAVMFNDMGAGCKLYFMNNTLIATHPTGGCLEFFGWTADYIEVFKNNILYSPNGYLMAYPLGLTFSPASKVNNNCMYRATGTIVAWLYGGGEDNLTWAEWQALGYDADGINENPDIDSSNEYRLLAGSPCLNIGADLSAYFTTDRDGDARPVGGAWDLGAYEGVG